MTTDPYRVRCLGCEALRLENDRLKTETKGILRRNLFGASWRALATMAIVATAIVIAGAIRGEMAKPDPPETCRETAEIIMVTGSTRLCQGGGRIETELLPKQDGNNQQVLVRCRCFTVHDAGPG